MLEPADVLLLDEPTNDLDIPTLEILEESLLEYAGALVLVTHDRYMLDRVSTMVLGLDGRGNAETFADYSQWEIWSREQEGRDQGSGNREQESRDQGSGIRGQSTSGKKKLSYLEAREYASIEDKVEAAEERLSAARDALEDPSVATNAAALTAALHELEQAQAVADEFLCALGGADGKGHFVTRIGLRVGAPDGRNKIRIGHFMTCAELRSGRSHAIFLLRAALPLVGTEAQLRLS